MFSQPLRTLRWLYVGRLTLAAGIFGGALGAWLDATPESTRLATLALFFSLAVTFGSLWYTYGLGRAPGRNFLYAQIIFDTVLVTTVVHVTGGAVSVFAPMYIVVIAAGALLLPLPGGMLIGALACMLYFADLIWLNEPIQGGAAINLGPLTVPAEWANAILQIGLFAVMALVTGALGDRLRSTGHALGAVESELRQLRLDTNDMLGAIDTGLVTVDDVGQLVYLNEAAGSLLKLAEREWRNRAVLDELDRRAPGLGSVIRRTASLGKPIRRFEIRMRDEVGHERFLGVRTTVLERVDQSPWVTAVFQDITDTKQIEDLMRRAERLQAVAELGASLAHEIKNPLASIRSAVEQLAGSRLNERDRSTLRGLVVTESDRLSRLLTDFMEFSRIELRRWGAVDLRKVTNDAIRLVRQHPDSTNRAQIAFVEPVDPVLVTGDEDLLHRAVFNLVLNAVQHSAAQGKVLVELGSVQRRDVPSTIPIERPVRLAVTDDGPGIGPEAVGRIFDPFFTTREGGTGLGLALVHRAVEAHQGMILVDGGPEHGAQFTVYLPGQSERRA